MHVIEGGRTSKVDIVSTHEGRFRAAPVLLMPLGIPLCPLHLAPRLSNREAIRSATPLIYILLVFSPCALFWIRYTVRSFSSRHRSLPRRKLCKRPALPFPTSSERLSSTSGSVPAPARRRRTAPISDSSVSFRTVRKCFILHRRHTPSIVVGPWGNTQFPVLPAIKLAIPALDC